MSFHYWGYVILTTCYLIKRKPSSAFENKDPYSILFPKEPIFSYYTTCCFVVYVLSNDMSIGLYQLLARAIKYVLLGYFRL